MTAPACSEEQFVSLFRELQSTKKVADRLGVSPDSVRNRKRSVEARLGLILPLSDPRPKYNTASIDQKAVASLKIRDGTVLIGSDIHLWPGERTTAQKAFIGFVKKFKPYAVVLNGDVLDSSSNNRHPRIAWQKTPTVQEELEVAKDYLDEILRASPNSKRFWPAGNHDLNLESRLANLVPEYRGVTGMHLKDHFPSWYPCWRIDINDDVVIKHRWANGIHAVYNNTLRSGKSFVTGHLHSLKVTPWTDLTGTRFGVDTGTLAEPYADQFSAYTEMNPVNWRSGFVLLTFKNGRLLWPEIISKFDDEHVEFRGEIIAV
jgi:hypothetical protein